jgi:hypothetical protein
MRVSERLDLISKIGRELQSRYTFDQLYSYLSAFKVPYLKDGPTDSKWSYSKDALDSQSDEVVTSIAEDLDIIEPSLITPNGSDSTFPLPQVWKEGSKFRLFISHLAGDKDKATRLKSALDYYQVSGFVAHEDILPTLEWQTEIERGLHAMHAMISIHTKGFSNSYWTQQEIGFALGRDTKIISLRMGEDPTGFISKHQALARRNRKAEEIAADINNLLHSDFRTKMQIEEAQTATKPPPFETIEMEPELASLLQKQHSIDFEAAGPKAPVPGYTYKGIHIESRWGVEAELEKMKSIINEMPESILRKITNIWCDSNATCTYSVIFKSDQYDPLFREGIGSAIIKAVGGHNGVYVSEEDGAGKRVFRIPCHWHSLNIQHVV